MDIALWRGMLESLTFIGFQRGRLVVRNEPQHIASNLTLTAKFFHLCWGSCLTANLPFRDYAATTSRTAVTI